MLKFEKGEHPTSNYFDLHSDSAGCQAYVAAVCTDGKVFSEAPDWGGAPIGDWYIQAHRF